jgi:hypothetical protein
MQWQEIIGLAEKQSDEAYDVADWVELINLCQDELTPYAKMKAPTSDITVSVDGHKAEIEIAYDIGLDAAHRILDVYYTPDIENGKEIHLRRLPTFNRFSKGWKMDSAKIYLQGLGEEAAGTVRVEFYKRLAHAVYDEGPPETFTPDGPEIPEEFHPIYVSFLCMKCQQREEEPEDKADFEKEYNEAKQAFAVARIAHMEPWSLKYLQQSNPV